jgi:hypothetical protein
LRVYQIVNYLPWKATLGKGLHGFWKFKVFKQGIPWSWLPLKNGLERGDMHVFLTLQISIPRESQERPEQGAIKLGAQNRV